MNALDEYTKKLYGRPLFSLISIETTNFCNRGCSFCPVGVDRKEVSHLSGSLIQRVFLQLSELGYEERLCFNWYNEPLADAGLSTYIRWAREACPKSWIYFNTNGDLLTPKLLDELVEAGVSLIQVSQYDGSVSPHIREIIDAGMHLDKLKISTKDFSKKGNSRGGIIENLNVTHLQGTRCTRPDSELIIDSNGSTPVCCNDYHVIHNSGNIKDRTLVELWGDFTKSEMRSKVRMGDRSDLICQGCNQHDISYEELVRYAERSKQ